MKTQMPTLIKQEKELSDFLSKNVESFPEIVAELLNDGLSQIKQKIKDIQREIDREKERYALENLTPPEVLIQYLANAKATYHGANGHGKASRNNDRTKYWKEILTKRNIPIPSDQELSRLGHFNGEGSC